MTRFQHVIAASTDPAAMVDPINGAQAERAAAQAELDRVPETRTIDKTEVHAMIDYLADVRLALKDSDLGLSSAGRRRDR